MCTQVQSLCALNSNLWRAFRLVEQKHVHLSIPPHKEFTWISVFFSRLVSVYNLAFWHRPMHAYAHHKYWCNRSIYEVADSFESYRIFTLDKIARVFYFVWSLVFAKMKEKRTRRTKRQTNSFFIALLVAKCACMCLPLLLAIKLG